MRRGEARSGVGGEVSHRSATAIHGRARTHEVSYCRLHPWGDAPLKAQREGGRGRGERQARPGQVWEGVGQAVGS